MEERNGGTQKFMSDDRSFNCANDSLKKFYFLPKSENNKTVQCSKHDFNWAKSISCLGKKKKNIKIYSPLHAYMIMV